MKQLKNHATVFIIILIVFILTLLSSCKKEVPKPSGNVDLTTQQVTISNWVQGADKWSYIIYQSISSGATINVSFQAANNQWAGLPFVIADNEMYFKYNSTSIEIDVRSASGNTVIQNPGANVFKIDIISPI